MNFNFIIKIHSITKVKVTPSSSFLPYTAYRLLFPVYTSNENRFSDRAKKTAKYFTIALLDYKSLYMMRLKLTFRQHLNVRSIYKCLSRTINWLLRTSQIVFSPPKSYYICSYFYTCSITTPVCKAYMYICIWRIYITDTYSIASFMLFECNEGWQNKSYSVIYTSHFTARYVPGFSFALES